MTREGDTATNFIRDLGDGLIMRHATADDAEALAQFNGEIHPDPGEGFADYIANWTKDLLTKPHPTVKPSDFTIVEDTATGKIVSSMNLISQTWAYAGIEFGVGRPELVGTHPDYRKRGLIRAQFEVIHQWSTHRGHKVQAITGIPYYYRQFGYEMALNLGGNRAGYRIHVPELKESDKEAYVIREAKERDLDFISSLYAQNIKRNLVYCVRNHDIWKYEFSGRSDGSVNAWKMAIIENPDGEPIGYLVHPNKLWGKGMHLNAYELKSGQSWLQVTPSVVRYLQMKGDEFGSNDDTKNFETFVLSFGEEHPAYDVFFTQTPRVNKPYAWYLRVPDIPEFIQHISPALENRLVGTPVAGHTGDLKFSFYHQGVRMVFEMGHITKVEPWQPTRENGDTASFPGLTFLQLLFGYRSMEELDHAFADCFVSGNRVDEPLIKILFPKKASHVIPIA
jgi:hypothetical protein